MLNWGDFVKNNLVITFHSVLFLLFFLLFAHFYEDLGLVGYFGYSDMLIFVIAPNLLYLSLSFLFKNMRKDLKKILLIGNLLIILAFFIGIFVWLEGWD
jgi:hypothetical protein